MNIRLDLLTVIISIWFISVLFMVVKTMGIETISIDMDSAIENLGKPFEAKNWHFLWLIVMIWISRK